MQAMSGRLTAARDTYAGLVREQPEDLGLLAGYAGVLSGLQDPLALEVAERAYKLAPDQAAVGDLYGWQLFRAGKAEAALRILREARLRDPSNVLLRWHLAAALHSAGRQDEARNELREAMAMGPQPQDDDKLLRGLRQALGL